MEKALKSTLAVSRSGRGFRYQDAATASLCVDSLRGALWTVVPEGGDDASIGTPEGVIESLREIQIREDNDFGHGASPPHPSQKRAPEPVYPRNGCAYLGNQCSNTRAYIPPIQVGAAGLEPRPIDYESIALTN
jgi:hypothetical protein